MTVYMNEGLGYSFRFRCPYIGIERYNTDESKGDVIKSVKNQVLVR